MRLLVCGSRDWTNRDYLVGVLDGIHTSQEVQVLIEGEAPGADSLARDWANGHRIKVLAFPVDWHPEGVFDKRAGVLRNAQMLKSGRPELVVAFWDRRSPGTADMIHRARQADIETWVFTGPKALPNEVRPPLPMKEAR